MSHFARTTRTLLALRPSSSTTTITAPRAFTAAAARRAADNHDSHYDAPGGWLWGVPPGQKAEKEGWEGIWYWGFYGSLGLAVVAYAFKPDSRLVFVFVFRFERGEGGRWMEV